MATIAERAAARARDIEKDLNTKLADLSVPNGEIAAHINDYRDACAEVIFSDIQYAAKQHVEDKLWAAHGKVRDRYKKQLSKLRKESNQTEGQKPHGRQHTARNKAVETRVLAKQYYDFIKSSLHYYRRFIQHLDVHYDGIPELREVARRWKDQEGPTVSTGRNVDSGTKREVLVSCYNTLIRLGDLSRYKCEADITRPLKKEPDWGQAVGYYGLATTIYPDSGVSHNQQAVVALAQTDYFRATYHLYRSLSVKEPHPNAQGNLEIGFKKVLSAWERGELINAGIRESTHSGKALVAWFIRMHSKCYRGVDFPERQELEAEVMSHLKIELKERSLDGLIVKFILINIAAQHFATEQLQAGKQTESIFKSYFFFLRLNAKTFITLLEILQPELEDLSGEDVSAPKEGSEPQLPDKITVVMRRVLPGIRLYSLWFQNNWEFVSTGVDKSMTTADVQELWRTYARVLTSLAAAFPAEQLQSYERYLLEEDVDTIGFLPLVTDKTRNLWYSGDALLPKFSDPSVGRQHPNIEMLMRIRDILIHGLQFAVDENAPLELEALRFVYNGGNILPDLPVSPKVQSKSAIPQDRSISNKPPVQAKTPATNGQATSKATPAESATATIAKDAAMSRMVDDLVGADEGEDENMPRTPPSHTFEDTTLVTDNTYGIGPHTAEDLVNQVFNYSKFSRNASASPRPAQNTAASPLMRHYPSIPSLPDQSNIWKADYGNSIPSSPYMGGFNDDNSPLVRPSGLHSRGQSVGSNRGSMHVPDTWSSIAPTHFGSSTNGLQGAQALSNCTFNDFDNSYHDPYGHGRSPSAANANFGMRSPFLFGVGGGPWGTPPTTSRGSTGRSPPNAQESPSLAPGVIGHTPLNGLGSGSSRGGFGMNSRTPSNGRWG